MFQKEEERRVDLEGDLRGLQQDKRCNVSQLGGRLRLLGDSHLV